MRMPRVRFTVRRLMVAVAVVSLVAWLEMWRRRVPSCRQQALRCAAAERSHLRLAEGHERIAALYRRPPGDPQAVVRYDIEQSVIFTWSAWSEQAKARRSAGRAEAFRRAAKYPWSPMPPGEGDPLAMGRVEQD